jgi:DsbC/DsbD-like thiol-disulfide interchange protein
LERELPRIKAQGLGLAAISYDSVEVLKNFASRRGITFPLLSDPESKIIRSFGILNESAPKNPQFFGIPHPGTYLVDPKGIVLAKSFVEDFRERDTAADLLLKQFGIRPEEAHATSDTKHFRVTTSATNQTVHQGQHLSLVVDIDLKPKMHVYAPGVQGGYIPIDWQVTESPDSKAGAVEYPKPEVLRLDAIKETVPVYQGHFRLTRELIIGTVKAPHDVTVKATLRYQACDDRECFLPATLPLEWVLHLEPLDTQRAPEGLRRK